MRQIHENKVKKVLEKLYVSALFIDSYVNSPKIFEVFCYNMFDSCHTWRKNNFSFSLKKDEE